MPELKPCRERQIKTVRELFPERVPFLTKASNVLDEIVDNFKGVFRVVAGDERGNPDYIRKQVAAVGEAGFEQQQAAMTAADITKKFKSMRAGEIEGLERFRVPTGKVGSAVLDDDQVLRLMFDNEGLARLREEDAFRVSKGYAPLITPLHEVIHDSMKELTDTMWGELRKYGLISAKAYRENYLTQLMDGNLYGINEAKSRMILKRGTPLSLHREFDNMFAAIDEAKAAAARSGKRLHLEPRYRTFTDNYVAMVRLASDAIRDAKIIEAAKKIPGGMISENQFKRIPTENMGQYHHIRGPYGPGFYVRDDIWYPARRFMEERPIGGFMGFMNTIKRIALTADFRHVLVTGRMVVTHPRALFDTTLWHDAVSKRLFEHPYLEGYVKAGGTPFVGGIGDYGNVNGIVHQLGLRHLIDASHKIIFDKIMPVQRAVTAFTEIDRVMRLREKGVSQFAKMSDDEIFRYAVKHVEPEFGRFESQMSPRLARAIQATFLAPEWNLSIARMTLNAIKEAGLILKGKDIEPYYMKRFAGMLGTTLISTAAANYSINKMAKTDYDPKHDWFRLVLPWKDPVTGRNLRLKTLGPQFEFFKFAFDLVDYKLLHPGRTKDTPNPTPEASVWTTAKALTQELADNVVARSHVAWKIPAMLIARKISGPQALSETVKANDPFTLQPWVDMGREIFSANHHVSPQTWSRAVASVGAMTTHYGAPLLAKEDYEVTSAAIAAHHSKAALYKKLGHPDMVAKEMRSAKEAKQRFIQRYENTDYWEDIAPYAKRLR